MIQVSSITLNQNIYLKVNKNMLFVEKIDFTKHKVERAFATQDCHNTKMTCNLYNSVENYGQNMKLQQQKKIKY